MFFVFTVWTTGHDSWDVSQKKWIRRVEQPGFGNTSVTKYDIRNLLTLTMSSCDHEGIGCLEAPSQVFTHGHRSN